MWRWIALLVAFALVTQGCSSDGDQSDRVGEVIDHLAAAGIAVYDDDLSAPIVEPAEPSSPLRLIRSHALGLADDLNPGSGLTAAQLDEMVPAEMVAGHEVKASEVIRAWAEDTSTPAAEQAKELLERPQGWPAEIPDDELPVFSTLLMLLFFGDLAAIGASLPDDPEMASTEELPRRSELRLAGVLPVAQAVPGNLCSAAVGFIHDSVAAAFDALRKLATPPEVNTGWGLFDDIANAVVGAIFVAVNVVIDGVNIVVDQVVRVTIGQVMSVVTKIAGVIGTVAEISNRIKPWTMTIEANPVRTEATGGSGQVIAHVETVLDEWPAWMVDCAEVARRPLPSLRPTGSPVDWQFSSILAFRTQPTDNALTEAGTATLRYTTINLRPTCAELEGSIGVFAHVSRNDVKALENLMMDLFETGVRALPGIDVVPGLVGLVNSITRPLAEEALKEARSILPSLRTYDASVAVPVTYWEQNPDCEDPPDESQPPPGTTQPQRTTTTRPPVRNREEPPCADRCGESVGDPHLVTVDGHHFEFQGAGEFVLLRSEDRAVDIQVRYEPLLGIPDADVSFVTAVATRLGDHRVVFVRLGGGAIVDGEPLLPGERADFGRDGVVEVFSRGIWVEYHDGTQLYVLGPHIIVDPSDELRSVGGGLIGPVTPGGMSIPPLPDGTVLPDPGGNRELRFELLYQRFGVAWRVQEGESLFLYGTGEGPETYNLDDFPNRERAMLDLQDLPPGLHDRGVAVCAGVSDESMRERCIFDVAVTGDVSWVADYVRADDLLTSGPSILVGEDGDPGRSSTPVEGRAGVPTLQLRSDLSVPDAGTHTGRLIAAEGTVLIAKTRLCPVGANVEMVIGADTGGSPAATRVPLCQDSPRFAGVDDDDEYLPTEAYVLLRSGGVYEVALVMSGADSAAIDVDIYVDPDPVVVRASGDDLSAVGGTYRLEHMADTVVFVLSHPGGNVAFSSAEGLGAGEACGKLERGGPIPGEEGGVDVWRLNFCAHTDVVDAGYLRDPLKVPMVVFNRTGDPVEVTLGPSD